MAATSRAPVWYVAHGGPPTLFQTEHPAYQHWIKIGQEMRNANLKGLVVISAHWQAELGTTNARVVQINTDTTNPMYYDYYGFPPVFFKLKFHATNPPSFSKLVADTMRKEGLEVSETKRGIDHGIYIPLKVCFKDELPADSPHATPPIAQESGRDGMPEGVPLCQVSLPDSRITGREAAEASIALGRSLRSLRDQGIGIMLGGQPVHNLRVFFSDLQSSLPDPKTGLYPPKTFSQNFSSAISKAVLAKDGGESGRDERVVSLVEHPAYKLAHPSDDHFLPLAAAIGASYADEPVKESLPVAEGGMAWNMYQWG
ncbi:hypothetical protein CF327_g917 [Tilletia walkeri]|uniref:Extradiol ring-cleavage dioxygenase class III enzyme subunit B domain-containing protein n=1 Tax=Tilletia walkeri TaxID=117179 RepID=A0A8X7N3C6_9BASI|nr:hypothetical protein CF327_g917 [Tilletia walkeri]KAE8266227.1 hypothetical protein A4X09_0g6120 [Tilletia walkeri]